MGIGICRMVNKKILVFIAIVVLVLITIYFIYNFIGNDAGEGNLVNLSEQSSSEITDKQIILDRNNLQQGIENAIREKLNS